jgi:hypothetical protein
MRRGVGIVSRLNSATSGYRESALQVTSVSG